MNGMRKDQHAHPRAGEVRQRRRNVVGKDVLEQDPFSHGTTLLPLLAAHRTLQAYRRTANSAPVYLPIPNRSLLTARIRQRVADPAAPCRLCGSVCDAGDRHELRAPASPGKDRERRDLAWTDHGEVTAVERCDLGYSKPLCESDFRYIGRPEWKVAVLIDHFGHPCEV